MGGFTALAGLITLALPMVIIGQNFADAYRSQTVLEEAEADAAEALAARQEAAAKMMMQNKFRNLKLGKKGGMGGFGKRKPQPPSAAKPKQPEPEPEATLPGSPMPAAPAPAPEPLVPTPPPPREDS